MNKLNAIKNVAFLSTYPPRECGLATFTEDLVDAIAKMAMIRPLVVAVTNGAAEYDDPRAYVS